MPKITQQDVMQKYTVRVYDKEQADILNFFNNPEKFDNLNVNSYVMGSPLQPLSKVYPEVVPLKDKCINDLYNDGLMTTQSINVTMTVQGMLAKRKT